MEFRILGPLEVEDESGAVEVRGRHHPRLLAMLTLDAGRVVPMSRLVDGLWDENPPATARRQVQNAMASLRRIPGLPVAAVGDGYRLDTDRVDALRFAEAVREAEGRRARGRPAEAHESLCRGLDLWRGPALAGVPGDLIASGAARLEERRLDALETRMELELELGRPGRVVGEARELLDANPYRQRLVGLLMRALHHGGRSDEALREFARLRRRLADDLGIDPVSPLRALHRDILRDDVDTARRTPVPATVSGVPAQLPHLGGFTGRVDALRALDALRDDASAGGLVIVTGTGGVGKTALAVEWARRNADRFPDGQLFVDLRGFDEAEPLSAHDALNRFLRALGHPEGRIPADLDEAAALYRSLLRGRTMLVVLDNANSVNQVRPLLPGVGGSFTLVTGRNDLTGLVALDGARVVDLDVLSHEESLALLAGFTGARRIRDEAAAADRIAALCGRLPLALRIVGALLASDPSRRLADMAEELADEDRLDRLAVPGDPRAAVSHSIESSHRRLDADTKRLFLSLGVVPAVGLTTGLARAVDGGDAATVDAGLDRLAASRLLERHGDRWRFHDLVRCYASRRAVAELDPGELDAARRRMLAWYGEPGGDHVHEDVLAVASALPGHPWVWRAVSALHRSVHQGRDPVAIRRAAEDALSVARREGDAAGLSVMHNLVAGTHWAERRIDLAEAETRLAVRWAREARDDVLLSRHLGNMAEFARLRGDNSEAARITAESLTLAERTGSPHAIAARLLRLGEIHTAMGEYPQAEETLLRAVCLASTPGHLPASQLLALGDLYLDLGRYTEAERCAERVLAGSSSRRMHALILRGRIRRATGDPAAGYADLVGVYRARRENRYVGTVARLLVPLAYCLDDLDDSETALRYARECLDACREGGPLRDLAAAHLLLATVHNGLSEWDVAAGHAESAAELYTRMGEPLRAGRSFAAWADALAGLGDTPAAERARRRAAEVSAGPGVTSPGSPSGPAAAVAPAG